MVRLYGVLGVFLVAFLAPTFFFFIFDLLSPS